MSQTTDQVPLGQSDSVTARAIAKLTRDLGPQLIAALRDPKTVEIMANADGAVWLERLGEPMQRLCELRAAQRQAIIETVAGIHDREVNRSTPLIEAELPLDKSRFAGQLPPVVTSPTFCIRKRAIQLFTLEQYCAGGIMSDSHRAAILAAIASRKNILVVGGTGSGKTTLVNGIIHEMVLRSQQQRICIIEDTGEIQCVAENCIQFHTTIHVDMTQLLKTALRVRPDRILVGEVRGPEALDLLMAWNTDHPGGAATLHANNAAASLDRLMMLVSMNPRAPREIERVIAEAVNLVVYISRTRDGRRVQEVLQVSGFENGRYVTRCL
jgi:type IV secretion system protein VirB11